MSVIAEDAAWNAALAGRFYRKEFANRPVFLCVDEETLATIGRDEGLAGDDAAQVLARAVRQRVHANDPLDAWTHDALVWRRSGFTGPPPFLSVLAVTVLAATMPGAETTTATTAGLTTCSVYRAAGCPGSADRSQHRRRLGAH